MKQKIIGIFLLTMTIFILRGAEHDICSEMYDALISILDADLKNKDDLSKNEPLFQSIGTDYFKDNEQEKRKILIDLQKQWKDTYEEYQGYVKLSKEYTELKKFVSEKDQQLRAIKDTISELCKPSKEPTKPASAKKNGISLESITVKEWPSFAQPEGPTCGFDAAKNSKHILDFAVGRISESELKKRLTAPIGSEYYQLAACRALVRKEHSLQIEDIEKILKEIYELDPQEFTVIPAPTQYNPAFLEDDQFEGIKKTVEAIQNKTPFVHGFILGNMEEVEAGKGTYGHWVTIVVQITQSGQIIFNFADSMGGFAQPIVDKLLKILQRDLLSDEIIKETNNILNTIIGNPNDLMDIEYVNQYANELNRIAKEKKWKFADVARVCEQQFITIFKRFNAWLDIFTSIDTAAIADTFFQSLWPYWQNIPAIKQNADTIRSRIHAQIQDMFHKAIDKTYATLRDQRINETLAPILSKILDFLQEQSGQAIDESEKLDALTQKNKWSYTDVSRLFTKEFNEILEWFNQLLLAMDTDSNFVAAMKSPTPTRLHTFLLKMGKYWIPMSRENRLQQEYVQELKNILDPFISNKKSIYWTIILDMQSK